MYLTSNLREARGGGRVRSLRERSSVSVKELALELAHLRRGAGLQAPDVTARVGPLLRTACGIRVQDDPVAAGRRVVERIMTAVESLPPGPRLAVQAALALPPASQARFLRVRMQWLGARIDRDPRTAARRVAEGLALLAERLLADTAHPPAPDNAYAPQGWYIGRLRSTLRLTADPVSLIEERTVVAMRDGLDHIAVAWSMPRTPELPPGALLCADVLFGGELIRDDSLSSAAYWTGMLRLPRALRAGESHEYQVRVDGMPRRLFRPHYVLNPHHRCDEFQVRVKFDVQALPGKIWEVPGVPSRVLDEGVPREPYIEPDDVGEVTRGFSHLQQGLNYGLQWTR